LPKRLLANKRNGLQKAIALPLTQCVAIFISAEEISEEDAPSCLRAQALRLYSGGLFFLLIA
jgi:hypothetical protein